MAKLKRWTLGLLAAAFVLFILNDILILLFLDEVVDYWWFSTLGYGGFYLLRLFYRYLIFGVSTLVLFLIFFLNFWVASRFLGSASPPSSDTGKKRLSFPAMVRHFRSGSMTVYAPLSLVLAIFIAIPLFQKWQAFLFYVFGPSSGIPDPAYGMDASFYTFKYPIYILLQNRLMLVSVILLAASALLYWIERRTLYKSGGSLPRGARIHLNILALFVIAIYGWSFMLQRYGLLYDRAHMDLFFGPGYTQMTVILPLIWGCLALWIIAALAVLYLLNFRKRIIPVTAIVLLFAGMLGLRYSAFLPNIVQRYIVNPNEYTMEAPYMARNIAATLEAYKLTDVDVREYKVKYDLLEETARAIRLNLASIPVWDRELLDKVYDQVQAIRPYYEFNGVDVGRYTVEDRYQQVNLAAREINLDKLPLHAQNWINTHFQYTHGYGVVMNPAAQSGEEFMVWYLSGIKPESNYELPVPQPSIYHGLENYHYVIAPNKIGELDYPMGDTFASSNYSGDVGIPLSSIWKKLLFAIYFKDRNILFTTKTTDDSRILFRRNIREAIGVLTPFFELDRDPYITLTPEGLFWIQDAYITSEYFPYSMPFDGKRNYIRNSVKITVNAYSGQVDFYIADPEDMFIRAYDRMYPGLLKPLNMMPKDLQKHIRYPKDIFKVQMGVYQKYHQTNTETFYREEDLWEFAEQPESEIASIGRGPMDPYFLTINLIDPTRREYLLLSPMNPVNRPNLRALAIAGCDGEHYGKFYIYSFPRGEQVYGPGQISALINQDTYIAEQFTLWDQAGSEVKRGRMIILPIGHQVFYIQPIYLTATGNLNIPQLQRLIISQGDVVAMDVSLEKAFRRVENELITQMKYQAAPMGATPKTQAPAPNAEVLPGNRKPPPKLPVPEPTPPPGVKKQVPVPNAGAGAH